MSDLDFAEKQVIRFWQVLLNTVNQLLDQKMINKETTVGQLIKMTEIKLNKNINGEVKRNK